MRTPDSQSAKRPLSIKPLPVMSRSMPDPRRGASCSCVLVSIWVLHMHRERGGKLKIAKLNVDENPRLSARFGVQAIPTMILFRGGLELDQIRGAVAKPELERRLARFV